MANKRINMIFIVLLIVSLLIGIMYELNLNKEVDIKINKANTLSYIETAQEHIVLWKRYHKATNSLNPDKSHISSYLTELTSAIEKSKQLENNVDSAKLSNSWLVYYNYFRAYMRFISSDVKHDKFSAEEAMLLISRIEKLDNDSSKFTTKQREWLANEGVMQELRHLKAYVTAIIYFHDKSSLKVRDNAIEALKDWERREESLEQKQVHEDRILADIFKLAFSGTLEPQLESLEVN